MTRERSSSRAGASSVRRRRQHAQQARAEATQVCIVGNGGVGKSALAVQFVNRMFVSSYDPTVEDSYRKQIVVDGATVFLAVLDTAGQPEYESLRPQWFQYGEGFILVYSICNESSFEHAINTYHDICDAKGVTDVPAVLVGSKCDMASNRCVTTQRAKQAAKMLHIPHVEVSAKDGTNVDATFRTLVQQMQQRHRLPTPAGAGRAGTCQCSIQ